MAQDWDIKPRGQACCECDRPFEDYEPYFSALIFGDEGHVRADYCEKCWPGKAEFTAPYSTWRGVFKKSPLPPKEALKRETAESLLRRMMHKEDESTKNVIYILAVMLERKRILVERDVQTSDDGTMIRVYEHRKTGETFLIPDPRLRLDQLEDVQRDVVAMLGGDEPSYHAVDSGDSNRPADEDAIS